MNNVEKQFSFRDANTKQAVKQAKDRLSLMELDVMEMELKARRQRAITQIKQDFITECEIDPRYQELLEIEKAKFMAEQEALKAQMESETNPEELNPEQSM